MLRMFKFCSVFVALLVLVFVVGVLINADGERGTAARGDVPLVKKYAIDKARYERLLPPDERLLPPDERPLPTAPPPAPFVGKVVHHSGFTIQELRHGWIIVHSGRMIFVSKPAFPSERPGQSSDRPLR
jgi:hypothetical protein